MARRQYPQLSLLVPLAVSPHYWYKGNRSGVREQVWNRRMKSPAHSWKTIFAHSSHVEWEEILF